MSENSKNKDEIFQKDTYLRNIAAPICLYEEWPAELYRSKREECAVAAAAIAGVAGNVVKAASAYEARSFGCYG